MIWEKSSRERVRETKKGIRKAKKTQKFLGK